MRSRLLLPVGLALACALHASVTGQVVVPALAIFVALAAAAAGPRWALPQAAQALLFVGTAGLVFIAALLDAPLSPQAGGPKLQYVIFSGAALMTVGPRLALTNPERGHPITWLIGLVAFYCCGRVSSAWYLPLAVAYLTLAWLHESWGARPSRRQLAVGAALLAITAGTASGATMGLRALYQNIDSLIIAGVGGPEVGFGAGAFRLGSMDGMRDSDEVILRVHGPADEHLRGQVYAEYGKGIWFPPDVGTTPAPQGAAPWGEVTVIEFVSPDQERLFLPPGAGAVRVAPSGVLVDALGVPRPSGGAPVEVRFAGGEPRFPRPPQVTSRQRAAGRPIQVPPSWLGWRGQP